MPIPDRLKITPQDIKIFKELYDHRMLRIDHVMLLTGRSREALKRRLLRLTRHGYLSCKRRPFQKYIYALGKQAVYSLAEQGTAPKEMIEARIRHHELKDLFLDHFMMIVDFHVALTLAARAASLKITWKQGDELKDHVTASINGRAERLSVWPDAFVILEATSAPAAHPVSFCFEADRVRGSRRDRNKILAYLHYFQQGLHKRKYGVDTFRVVRFTRTKERAANLCALTGEIIPAPAQKYYLFSSLDDISLRQPLRILENIFITPHDRQRRALIASGPLAATGNLM